MFCYDLVYEINVKSNETGCIKLCIDTLLTNNAYKVFRWEATDLRRRCSY